MRSVVWGPYSSTRVFHSPATLQVGLQEHDWSPQRPYDCIWIQWCLLYLTDPDVIVMFNKTRQALAPDGLIFVKENICKEGFVVDNVRGAGGETMRGRR